MIKYDKNLTLSEKKHVYYVFNREIIKKKRNEYYYSHREEVLAKAKKKYAEKKGVSCGETVKTTENE